ncbi:MAG TPA: alkaline phosphatase D family protein, partial [Thermoanaerobaculia bacterium]|nr:alkaline phosphatase D family protein [Thermoanaerobaculia bacterium]
TPNANTARTFVGIFEFVDPSPGLQHVVDVQRADVNSERATISVRSIPAEVPQTTLSAKPLRILLVSCFHSVSDPRGMSVGRHAAEFVRQHRPDLTFFLGDQVYVDLPVSQTPEGTEAAIAEDIERKYLANWIAPSQQPAQRGYYEVLSAAPAIFNADDHEYWNNYPHFSPQLKNTWRPGPLQAWSRAAERMWSAFQLHHGVEVGQPFVVNDIAPLSILFVDTRSMRKNGVLFDARGTATINAWSQALRDSPDRVGMFVTGQSIFDRKTRTGTLLDKNLLDFPAQYDVLVNAVKRATAKRPVLCITGDVHFGRVLTLQGTPTSGRLFEVISSPASLVDNPITNVQTALNPFDDPDWPKHEDAPGEDELHFNAFPGDQYVNTHAQRGNHVTMLSLTRTGAAIHVEALYKPMHPRRHLRESVVNFTLR